MENAKRVKIIAFLTLTTIVISLSLVAYFSGTGEGDVSNNEKEENVFMYDFKINSNYLFYDSALISLNDSDLKITDFNKDSNKYTEVELNDPVLKILNRKILVYEQSGLKIQEYDKKLRKLNEIELEGNILDIFSVSENYIGIVYEKKRYTTSLRIVDNSFKTYFERAYDESYVIDTMLYGNNQILIFLTDAEDEKISTYIERFDYESRTLKETVEIGNEVFTQFFIDENNIFIASSNHILTVNESDIIYEKNYEDDRELICVNKLSKGKLLLHIDEGSNNLQVISFKGKILKEIKVEDTINDIIYYNGKIYVVKSTDIEVFDENLENKKIYQYNDIIKKVDIDKDTLCIIYNDSVVLEDIN